MGALQHAKDKSGVFGAEGRKAWETQEQNAVEGMKSQLVYADHMIRWSALQEAAGKVKQMMEDPDIDQPNTKSYVKDYMANALGQSTSKFAFLRTMPQWKEHRPSILRPKFAKNLELGFLFCLVLFCLNQTTTSFKIFTRSNCRERV